MVTRWVLQPRPQNKKPRNSRGQISILVIFSMIPLLTLFAFAVNIGMLVHAKIALQNAADLAAYNGAATQARQLTQISHLNYQMRQVYKKFLYRYYVLGNLSLKCFPGNRSNSPDCVAQSANKKMVWTNPGGSYPGVPSVCFTFDQSANACQLGTALRLVTMPPCNPLDPFSAALCDMSQQIREVQRKSCKGQSAINQEILGHWLYATSYNSPLQSTNLRINAFTNDIGLFTEELLLKFRIDTLKSYINTPGEPAITQARIVALENEPDLAKSERSLLAFKTAIGNLNPKVFFPETIMMREVIPQNMLKITPVQTSFQAFFSYMDGGDSSGNNCEMQVKPFEISPYVGVYKDEPSMVFYAIQLKAKAQLLFNPFPFGSPDEGVTLTAYSAAMPFGSRIGPRITASDFVTRGTINTPDGPKQVTLPWLRVTDPNSQEDIGYDDTRFLEALLNAIRAGGGQTGSGLSAVELAKGQAAALFPTDFEIGKYNIPVDTTEAAFIPKFSPTNPAQKYTFWAPVISPSSSGNFEAALQDEVERAFGSVASTAGDSSSITRVKQAIKDRLIADLGRLFGSGDPSKESRTIARIPNPIDKRLFGASYLPQVPGVPVSKIENNPGVLATSYATEHDWTYFQGGRDGYSVKFVPFDKLMSKSWTISNLPSVRAPTVTDMLSGDLSDLKKVTH